jgi:predicted metal-dependent HD superfamily phosphohydrolase
VAAVDELAHRAENPDATRLAAWFHDAVYVPGAGDNEAQSAAFAADQLGALALAPALIREVERLIRLTGEHRAAAGDGNGQVLVDADLAILGAPPAAYVAYARAIRQEYAFVEPERYRRERIRILRRFLARPHIYYNPAWQQEREPQARQNLRAEIASLAT